MEGERPPILNKRRKILGIFIVLLLSFCLIKLEKANRAPNTFPVPYNLTIDPGQSLFSISAEVFNDGAITSPRVFEFWMLLFGSDRKISEGSYHFKSPTSALGMALRISGRQFGIDRKKVTFPEGFTHKEMAARLKANFENFDQELFIKLAAPYEGYLFPDTYSFFPNVQPDVVVDMLRDNFSQRTEDLEKDFAQSNRKKEDIIIMASIVEKEGNGPEDRQVIAGILWKRLDNGIPLQVDAPFLSLLGKSSAELTRKDLAIDSPFNTYKYKGLPPAPIANPGIDAIKATLNPVSSPYLYYLHDTDGKIYYAKTYAEHLENIRRYLRSRN